MYWRKRLFSSSCRKFIQGTNSLQPHESPSVIPLDKFRLQRTPSPVSSDLLNSLASTRNMNTNLSALSQAELIERCTRLEQQLKAQTAEITELTRAVQEVNGQAYSSAVIPKKPAKHFDATRHSTRFIALKFSYLGHRYNGFEHANRCFTPLPTIEEVLWKALRKARLISPPVPGGADASFDVLHDPKEREQKYYIHGKSRPADEKRKQRLEISWEGCQYSKCGRTDRGVSAFGQVIGIRVRSNAPMQKREDQPSTSAGGINGAESDIDDASLQDAESAAFDSVKDELPYVYMLNMILPPDIRVLAWCPDPPEGFDARYSCLERRYKYFFTNPAFCPTPGPMGLIHADGTESPVREGWLDIERMKQAAKKLEGVHDYRNLCQIDASKQMPSCRRRITFADVEEFESSPVALSTNPELNASGGTEATNGAAATVSGPRVYAIAIHGSAFLWHQVRCTAAVLFMVGQGLESPDIIDQLLDVGQNPGRPHYTMADDAPLVLWDCVFRGPGEGQTELHWIYAGDEASIPALVSKGDGKFGLGGVVDTLWTQWQEAKLREAQIGGLLSIVMANGDTSSITRGGFRDPNSIKDRSQKLFEGNGHARLIGKYQPLMNKRRMDTLEALNARYLATVKGSRRFVKKEQPETQD